MKATDYLRDLFSMEGKVVLIAGASSGIGAHLAEIFAKAGGDVVLGARRLDKVEYKAKEISDLTGRRAVAVELDVTNQESVDHAFNHAQKALGVPTVVLNNAGLARPNWAIDDSEEDFDVTMDTNLKGMWRVAMTAAKRLRDAGKAGAIINTASILGLGVSQQQCTYATSKAAVVQMTKSMGLEFQRFGIRVNAVCPGYFKTEINDDFLDSELGQQLLAKTPARRAGKLDELASAYLMLAGDGASFITGVALPVDSAHSVRIN